jgi:hypothetical protein
MSPDSLFLHERKIGVASVLAELAPHLDRAPKRRKNAELGQVASIRRGFPDRVKGEGAE